MGILLSVASSSTSSTTTTTTSSTAFNTKRTDCLLSMRGFKQKWYN